MKFGKGVVKKYSREYYRTLKSGEKKKYTTKQIQITIPKNEDIYENKEEVLIIPNSEIEDFKSRDEEIEFLKVANYLYVNELRELEMKLENNDMSSTLEYKKEIEELKAKIENQDDALNEIKNKYQSLHQDNVETQKFENEHSKLIAENENLKNQYSIIKQENENLKTQCNNLREEHASVRESYNKVSRKYDLLKQENLNTKTSYAEIYEINAGLENDYDSLLDDYNNLVDKFNDLQDELYSLKFNQSRDDLIAYKVKEFILNRP